MNKNIYRYARLSKTILSSVEVTYKTGFGLDD
jgi:hypothetical protein